MRFQPKRCVQVCAAVVGIWLVVVIFRVLQGGELDEDDKLNIGPPVADTDFPPVFYEVSTGHPSIPVVVVEEHQEVLKYWFGASSSGLLPRRGNVLLHIDGHGDSAVPLDLTGLPLFRPPLNNEEIRTMMQRNDVFIVIAALAGLLDRFIWVWPPWDEENHDEEHIIVDVEIGSTVIKQNGIDSVELCCCFEVRDSKVRECRRRNDSEPAGDGIVINRSQCALNRSGVFETVSEQRAIALLQTGKWITADDSLILDIDEDYYGCQSAAQPLYSTKIHPDVIETLGGILSELFCATSVHHEKLVDTFFHSIIELVYRLKLHIDKTYQNTVSKRRYIAVQRILYEILPDIVLSLQEDPVGTVLCSNPKDAMNELLLQGLIRHIAPLNLRQLDSLGLVGACLRSSPKVPYYDVKESVYVCKGLNSPNSTDVIFHSPTPSEIYERTNNLRKMLKSPGLSPSLVTVCRSVRDGYTPRHSFPRIESDILKAVHEAFPNVHYTSVYHDKDLLGGVLGWHDREFVFERTFVYQVLKDHLPEL